MMTLPSLASNRLRSLCAAGLIAGLLPAASARAEPTRELYISDPKEVFQGDPVSTSVDAQGHVSPGPMIDTLGPALGRAITAIAASRGGLLVGTAGGGLHRISADKATQLLEADGRVVTAVLDRGRTQLAALAPEAEIVRVGRSKTRKTLVSLKAKYVWGMAENDDGAVLVTGQPGQVVALTGDDRTEVWLEPEESHLRAVIRHPQRGWIVGGGQKGIVYQLVGNKKARALYDSKFEEVTAFAIDPTRGDLYAAFVSAETSGKPLPERWIGPTDGETKVKPDRSPFKGSEVVRIRPSGQVEVLWSSNDEGALDLVFDAKTGRLYFCTGTAAEGRARVYAVDARDRDRLSLWGRLEPPLAPAMVPGDDGTLLLGTAPTGQAYRLGRARRDEATYLSVEQDLARTARLGRVWFDADVPKGAQVAVSMRSGNTKKPDATWSDWSAAVTRPDGGPVSVPNARYVQFRAVLKSSPSGAPRLKSMHASVVRHNSAPTVREVFMLRRGIFLRAFPRERSHDKTISLSTRTLSDLRKPDKAEKLSRVRQEIDPGMMTIAWRATDEDGDDLLYRVEMRRIDAPAGRWREVASNQEEAFWSFDSRAYPDGRYQFRITASDRPTNAPKETLTDRHVSEPVLVDNTAPRLSEATVRRERSGRLTVSAMAQDDRSRLQSAEVSVNGGPWLMLPAKDGLLDARQEALQVELRPEDLTDRQGALTVRIRVEDDAGNLASVSAQLAED